jgi:hypothetical protein
VSDGVWGCSLARLLSARIGVGDATGGGLDCEQSFNPRYFSVLGLGVKIPSTCHHNFSKPQRLFTTHPQLPCEKPCSSGYPQMRCAPQTWPWSSLGEYPAPVLSHRISRPSCLASTWHWWINICRADHGMTRQKSKATTKAAV